MSLNETLLGQVNQWIENDPDEVTVATLKALVTSAEAGDEQAEAEVTSAFAGPLTFGTAGLRAALGPGPGRMNRVVVSQAAAGFAAWLKSNGLDGGKVLIGYDARHNSDIFARDTAEIMAAAGFEALLTRQNTPTPVVAFGIKHFGCVAAVVVTASHNPPADNGYKVYLGDGSQIIPPTDTDIAAQIAVVAASPLSSIPRSDAYTIVDDELVAAYVEHTATIIDSPSYASASPGDNAADATGATTLAGQPSTTPNIKWAYTPMHGVGARVVLRLIEAAGYPAPACVAEQMEPDADFPTVKFPNPEEPGAMDLLLALAKETGADIAVATDPDADRCACAVPIGGVWRRLTGDELGSLLGDDAIRRGKPGLFANSLVSSTLLRDIALANGREHITTLTGFKWIGRIPGLAFGYEEAIGYCLDAAAVPDKDGISTTLWLLRLVSELKAAGLTVEDRLNEIDATYGIHATRQVSLRVTDLAQIPTMMAAVRANPPSVIAGEPVEVADLNNPTNGLPPTDGMEFTGASVHAVVRPSGTEPKLKCYLEARRPIAPAGTDLAAERAAAETVLDALWSDIKQVLGA
jgi:phosphomannomutase